MKRLIIIATALFLSVALFAQDAHLKFKGIPLEGNYKAFAQKLIQKGFRQLSSSDAFIVLSGTFMANSDTQVFVYPDPSSKVVSGVVAIIGAGETWSAVEREYYSVVNTYREKYGEPSSHVEEFKEYASSDVIRLLALENGSCNYRSIWETESGRIEISLTYYMRKNYVACAYVDELNYEALHKSILEDI